MAHSVVFEEWLVPGCPSKAFLTAHAADTYCVNLGDYPGKSIRLRDMTNCPKGESGWIEVSSKECDSFTVDRVYPTNGECQDVDFSPLAIRSFCR